MTRKSARLCICVCVSAVVIKINVPIFPKEPYTQPTAFYSPIQPPLLFNHRHHIPLFRRRENEDEEETLPCHIHIYFLMAPNALPLCGSNIKQQFTYGGASCTFTLKLFFLLRLLERCNIFNQFLRLLFFDIFPKFGSICCRELLHR